MDDMTTPPPAPMDQAGVRAAYDVVAEDFATHLPDTRAEAPLDLAMIDAFIHAVGSGDDIRVLDGGCGAGRISGYLSTRGCAVEGIDLSPAMVAMARRDHPGLTFSVGSLTSLPYADHQFAGVLLWYSIIHTPPAGLPALLHEAARVLRPGGHLLIGFQAGEGTRDVSQQYSRFGHQVRLERYLHPVAQVADELAAVGVTEVARLVRRPEGSEADDQAVLLARVDG